MKERTTLDRKHLVLTILASSGLGLALAGCCERGGGGSKAAYYSAPPAAYAGTTTTTTPKYETTTTTAATTTTTSGDTIIPLYEESLNVGKRQVDTGGVRVKKIVKTETVSQPVELRREEIVIEREPAGAATSTAETSQAFQQFQEGETVIRATREVPVIEKQVTSAGRIVVQRRSTGEQTNVQMQVRKEDIDVAKLDDSSNVIISESVKSSSSGAAATPGGQSTGSGGTITDVTTLTVSSDPSSAKGRRVQLSSVKVQKVHGNGWISVTGTGGRQVLVRTSDTITVKEGDTVEIMGQAQSGSAAQLGLEGEAAQVLSTTPIYIQAESVKTSTP